MKEEEQKEEEEEREEGEDEEERGEGELAVVMMSTATARVGLGEKRLQTCTSDPSSGVDSERCAFVNTYPSEYFKSIDCILK